MRKAMHGEFRLLRLVALYACRTNICEQMANGEDGIADRSSTADGIVQEFFRRFE
jgi:hypothetical protein